MANIILGHTLLYMEGMGMFFLNFCSLMYTES